MNVVLTGFLIVALTCSLFLSVNDNCSFASTNQIYWGAWVSDATDGHIGNINAVTAFASTVGKGLSIWNWIQLWNRPDDSDNLAEFDIAQMTACRNAGMIPMVSWAPEGPASGDTPVFNSLQDILNGNFDSYLIAWGNAAKAWNHPFFVRLMWEFTGSWAGSEYPWGSGNTPALFVQAWQYIVNKVRSTGENDISWVWCPADVGDTQATLLSVYPGDNYVDWIGTDIYIGTGQTFAQGAQPELPNIHAVAPNKPVMILESGYSGSDTTYWSNLLTNILPNSYPYVQGLLVWQGDGYDVTRSMLSSFKSGISSSYYSSNVYSSLNASPIATVNDVSTTPTPAPPHGSVPPYQTSTPDTKSPFGFSINLPLVSAVLLVATSGFVALYGRKSRRSFN